jgi:predicted flap endonuclease-1-like 5' DNA nuclease
MAKVNRILRVILIVGLGAALGGLLIYWLIRVLRQEEETEEAVRVRAQRLAELPIPLSPEIPEEQFRLSTPPAGKGKAAADPDRLGDDLTRIVGIGPKYAEALRSLGLGTYRNQARQDPHDLAIRLREKGVRVIGDRIAAEDWIGQARLLAGEAKG